MESSKSQSLYWVEKAQRESIIKFLIFPNDIAIDMRSPDAASNKAIRTMLEADVLCYAILKM